MVSLQTHKSNWTGFSNVCERTYEICYGDSTEMLLEMDEFKSKNRTLGAGLAFAHAVGKACLKQAQLVGNLRVLLKHKRTRLDLSLKKDAVLDFRRRSCQHAAAGAHTTQA